MFIYVGGGAGTKMVVHIYKMASACRVQCKDCEGGFSFFLLHLGSKCTFEGLTNAQEMWSRILELKGMGFKVLKVTMSPRYIRRTISHCKVARTTMLYMNASVVWGKGKLSSYCISFLVLYKKNSQDV